MTDEVCQTGCDRQGVTDMVQQTGFDIWGIKVRVHQRDSTEYFTSVVF